MKKVLILAVALLAFVGCSNGSKTVVKCVNESGYPPYESAEMTFTAKDDRVLNLKGVYVLDLKTESTKKEVMEQAEKTLEEANAIEGVKASIEDYNDNDVYYIYDIMEIDLTKADFDVLRTKGYLNITKGADYVSLEKTTESLETVGLTCVTE